MKVTANWNIPGIEIVFEGSFSTAEFLYHQSEILQDSRMKEIEYKIIDFTKADLTKMEVEDSFFAVSAVHKQAQKSPGHRTAFIATDNHTIDVFNSFRNEMMKLNVQWDIRIFETHSEAAEWINSGLE
ncbi:MAG: hypothetical protein AB3N63_17600 [Puniceicoccaceae bacterium]